LPKNFSQQNEFYYNNAHQEKKNEARKAKREGGREFEK